MNAVNPTLNRAMALLNTIPQPPFNVINPKNRRVIARVGDRDVSIVDKGKRRYINALGINIPPFLRQRFEFRSVVYQGDSSFYEAFITAECWNLLRGGYRFEKVSVTSLAL